MRITGRLFALAMLAAFFIQAACAQALLSPAQFRDAGIARIQQAEPTAEIRVADQHMIVVTIPGDAVRDGVEVNFERAYQAYRQDPSQRDALLHQWVRLALEAPLQQFTRERLVVVVRGQLLVDSYNHALQQRYADAHLIVRPFIGDLHAVLAFDTGDAIAYATPDQIEGLNLSVEEAWNTGFSNLDALMGDLRVATNAEGISYVDSESGLATSFLMNSEVCRSGAAGDVILVTTRDGYIFADQSTHGRIRSLASIIIGPDQPESRTVLSCRNGALAPASP